MTEEKSRKELTVDPEFERICHKLTPQEFTALENTILEKGEILSPIITWNGIIVDGHHRYKIAQKHPEIPYKTTEIEFPDRSAAIAWICNTQLGRRNINKKQANYLLGQKYEAEKQMQNLHGNRYTKNSQSTRAKVAKFYGISESKVKLAYMFYQGVEAAEEVMPGIKDEILSEIINPTDQAVYGIARLPAEKRKEAVEKFREELKRKTLEQEMFMLHRDDILEKFIKATEDFLDLHKENIEKYPQLLTDSNSAKIILKNLDSINNYFSRLYLEADEA